MTDENHIAIVEPEEPAALAHFDRMMKAAEVYAEADILPKDFRGKPANVLIAMELAHRSKVHFLAICQNLYVIDGRPSWYTSFLIALCNVAGVFEKPITWTANGKAGKELAVTAHATLRGGQEIDTTIDMAEAERDGWTRNKKYQTIPGQMLRWRTASRLINLYVPQVRHGIMTVEELQDGPEERETKTIDVTSLEAPAKEKEKPAAKKKPPAALEEAKEGQQMRDNTEKGVERALAEPEAPSRDEAQASPPQLAPPPQKPTQRPLVDGRIQPAQVDALLAKLAPAAEAKGVAAEQVLSELARLRCGCAATEVSGELIAVLAGAVNKYVLNFRRNREALEAPEGS